MSKKTPEELKEYDKRFEGRMNPRDTFHCDVCNKYYNGESTTVHLIAEEEGRTDDCVHGDDIEINEQIYDAHMKDLEENDFI